jgi:pilus assembly protein FimV
MDQKENQPLELEELDLTLPDDLSAGGDFAAGSGLDDLDLDLPELTAEDEADSSLSVSDDMPETAAAPALDVEDEEPIALSEEELERIMGSSDASLTGDFADAEGDVHEAAPEMEMGQETSDVPDLDLAMDMETDISGSDFGSAAESPLPDMDMDFADMHTDLEDEGPVALSEEELGSIMGDVSEHRDAPSGPDDAMLEPDFGEDLAMPDMEMAAAPAAGSGSEEDEENITLSDDELNNILLDASDLEISRSAEPAEAPRLSEMGLDEEDEPIALTAEELGNIISDVSEVADAGGHEPQAGMLDEEDEGPVALSDAELNSILEDVHEEAEAPSAAPPRPHCTR